MNTRSATTLIKRLNLPLFCFLVLIATAQSPIAPARPLALTGEVMGTHDPSIIKDKSTYYVFSTGAAAAQSSNTSSAPPSAASSTSVAQLPVRCSPDLQAWRRCGSVFPSGIPEWIQKASPLTRELWAPDISFYRGQYHLYYAYSVFGKNTSGIALATNSTLDEKDSHSPWIDQGMVLESTAADDYNAIDPNLILDEHGDAWLAFGSFWSGIKMRKLDAVTGKLSQTDTTTYSLAARARPSGAPGAKPGLPPDWEAVEAPFIFHHGDYFYLFVSWDLCCRGAHSTYRTMVGRSRSVHGPYLDREGKAMMDGGGTPVPTANERWAGPGGESLLHDGSIDILIFHAYDAQSGRPALQISTLAWKDGWPSAALEMLPK